MIFRCCSVPHIDSGNGLAHKITIDQRHRIRGRPCGILHHLPTSGVLTIVADEPGDLPGGPKGSSSMKRDTLMQTGANKT